MEDGTLKVVSSASAAIVEFEGIDVESGTVAFYDAQGKPLEAWFTSPNKTRFGFLVSSGAYELRPTARRDGDAFALALFETVALEANEWFATLDDLKREMRRRGVNVDHES